MSLVVTSDITRHKVKMIMFCVLCLDLRINIIFFLKEVNVSLFALSRHIGRVEVQHHPFLTLTEEEGEWLTSSPVSLLLGNEPLYTLNDRLGVLQGRFGIFFREDTVFETQTIYPIAYSLFLHNGSSVFFLFRFNLFIFIFESECVSTQTARYQLQAWHVSCMNCGVLRRIMP